MKRLTQIEAAELLRRSEVVAIPTETVYGLAADARCDVAVGKIFKAKGRPADNPLIVHIGAVSQVDELATNVSQKARLLMDRFWPGPLTVILPSNGCVSSLVTAGLKSVGVRMPDHPQTLALLQALKVPLAAPSANLSGKPSPTTAAHVAFDLKGRIPGVLDGGVCQVGLESTVIDMTKETPVILRPGGIDQAEIEAVIGCVEVATGSEEKPKSPGMKYTHYAPDAQVYVVKGSRVYMEKMVRQYGQEGNLVGVLSVDANGGDFPSAKYVKNIGFKGKHLYAALRDCDAKGIDVVLCEWVSDAAVMDRLLKASEERVLNEVED